MAIHLGVSVCSSGGAALYNTSTRELIALTEESQLGGRRLAPRRYAGPALPSYALAAAGEGGAGEERAQELPKASIRACLDATGLSWADISAVRVSGPEGALERLRVELLGVSHERVTAGPSPQLALARYAVALGGGRGRLDDALIIATDPLHMHGELSERGGRRAYSVYHARGGDLHLTHERLLSPHLAPLSCPAQAYLALAERARLSLEEPLSDDAELLPWASELAAEGEVLPNIPPWFTASSSSLDLETRAYDLWLDVISLERRLARQSADLGASARERRALWASLLRKAQGELAAALSEVARGALSAVGGARLALVGVLSGDPRLCDLLREQALVGSSADVLALPAGGGAVAAAAAGLGETPVDGHASARSARATRVAYSYSEPQISAALEGSRGLLEVKSLEQPELERDFAQRIAEGEAVARYEGRLSLTAHPATTRALLLCPTLPRARTLLSEELARRSPHAPVFVLCPEERSGQLFTRAARAPLTPTLAAPRPELLERLRPALRADGLALLITVSREQDPALVRLCEALWTRFNLPPLLLASPLTQRSGQPVDTPAEAARWLLGGQAHALLVGRRWVTRRGAPAAPPLSGRALAESLAERLAAGHPALTVAPSSLASPRAAAPGDPPRRFFSSPLAPLWADVERLDALIFSASELSDEWDDRALEELSRHLAPHRSSGGRLGAHPLHDRFEPSLPGAATLLLNPRGLSRLIDEGGRWPTRLYSWPETLALTQLLFDDTGRLERVSRPLLVPPREARRLVSWALAELETSGLRAQRAWRTPPPADDALVEVRGAALLAPFQDPLFSLRAPLELLWARLHAVGYTEELLAPHRGGGLPAPLPDGHAGALARLFWLGEELPRAEVVAALGEPSARLLTQLGVLWGDEGLRSRLALDCVAGAYIATDFLHAPRGRSEHELPCPPLSPLARGAVCLALSRREGLALDASETYGAVSVSLARSAEAIVTLASGERALRFTRFNLQLNGVERAEALLGRADLGASSGLFHTIFSAHEEVTSRLGALLSKRGRVCVMSANLAALQERADLPPGLRLTLPLSREPAVRLEDPRLHQGFGAVAGYWLFELSQRLAPSALPLRLHRPLCAVPTEGTQGLIEHVFSLADERGEMRGEEWGERWGERWGEPWGGPWGEPWGEPRRDATGEGGLQCAPHPELALIKRSGARGQVELLATHERWPGLTPIALREEVFAQLKSLVRQRLSAPLTPTGVVLAALGLKVLRRAEGA